MTKGFITLGINTEKDRIRYCYYLAQTIKQSDPEAEVCLVVDKDKSDLVPQQYFHAFDYITELPFGNSAHKDGFHGMNIWQMIHCTPFEETIYLDSDTIFKSVDTEVLWDSFQHYDIAIPRNALTYRNQTTNKQSKFDIEKHYGLPELYNNIIYFKRDSAKAIEWFKMADPVFQNWREIYTQMFKERKPNSFNKNILANIVTHLLDVEDDVSIEIKNHYDLDNRSQRLWHQDIPEDWTTMLNFWYTDDQNLIIENSVIGSGIIHYGDEKFLTEEVTHVIRTQTDISDRRKATA